MFYFTYLSELDICIFIEYLNGNYVPSQVPDWSGGLPGKSSMSSRLI